MTKKTSPLVQYRVKDWPKELRVDGDVKIIRESQAGENLDVHVNVTHEGIIVDVVGHFTGTVYATNGNMFEKPEIDVEGAERKEALSWEAIQVEHRKMVPPKRKP